RPRCKYLRTFCRQGRCPGRQPAGTRNDASRRHDACRPAWSGRPLRQQIGRAVMKVKQIMHSNVEWAEASTPVAMLAKKMSEQDIGCIPVGENDRLVGMVTDRDIAMRAVANGHDIAGLTARDVMTKGIVFCRETDNVADAVQTMESRQIRRLPV